MGELYSKMHEQYVRANFIYNFSAIPKLKLSVPIR